jgi:hypothetical protein
MRAWKETDAQTLSPPPFFHFLATILHPRLPFPPTTPFFPHQRPPPPTSASTPSLHSSPTTHRTTTLTDLRQIGLSQQGSDCFKRFEQHPQLGRSWWSRLPRIGTSQLLFLSPVSPDDIAAALVFIAGPLPKGTPMMTEQRKKTWLDLGVILEEHLWP